MSSEKELDTENNVLSSSEIIQEGKAKIIVCEKNIFYNPVQEFNRDLSIAVLSQYSKEFNEKINKNDKIVDKKGLRVLEALSATGLRSIRYAKEVSGIHEIVANDISIKAVEAMKKNIIFNEVENIVKPNVDDATMVMYQSRKSKFNVVDLDPYGCPSIFLDGAVQCLQDDGLLMVTATDMAVLAGNSPETCYVKYNAISLKSKSCHEMALRILLQHIASHAGRYGKVITPLLSISADFYVRVFVKLNTSQKACKKNITNLGVVYQCTGCGSVNIQPLGITPTENVIKLPSVPAINKLCDICQHKHHMGGPIWIGKLHNKDFIGKILSEIDSKEDNNLKCLGTIRRICGMLHMVEEELENVPLYYQLDRLMSIIRSNTPPMAQFRSAILNAGYEVSYSHANKYSIKTNAPNQVIWDIIRAYEKENPVKREKLDKNSAGLAILNAETTTEVSFSKHPGAVPPSMEKKMTRFQLNPSAYWGPGTRATTIVQDERKQSKREKNQNKKRKREKNDDSVKKDKKANVDVHNP